MECLVDDTCDGAGSCTDNGFETSGTACGDASDTECTDPDSCDGSGSCQPNDATSGTACGDPSDTTCTNPDSCDGAGVCAANNEANGTSCDDGNSETFNDQCTDGICAGVFCCLLYTSDAADE